MITILHGGDIVSSRKVLEAIRASHDKQDTIILDAKKTDFSSLKLALETPAFFSHSRLVILENFFGTNPKKESLDYLSSGEPLADLVVWENKEISQRLPAKLSRSAQIRLFKTPAVVFKFLDSLYPKNARDGLLLLHKTLEKSSASLVFYLLVRHVRELILVKSGQRKGLAFWKLRKLLAQVEYFSFESLRKLYRKLLLIDLQQKTGQSRFDLIGELEMIVLEIDESLAIS